MNRVRFGGETPASAFEFGHDFKQFHKLSNADFGDDRASIMRIWINPSEDSCRRASRTGVRDVPYLSASLDSSSFSPGFSLNERMSSAIRARSAQHVTTSYRPLLLAQSASALLNPAGAIGSSPERSPAWDLKFVAVRSLGRNLPNLRRPCANLGDQLKGANDERLRMTRRRVDQGHIITSLKIPDSGETAYAEPRKAKRSRCRRYRNRV